MNTIQKTLYITGLMILSALHAFSQEERTPPKLLISPMTGWVQDKILQNGQTDSSSQNGLYVMYVTPRFMINNTTTFADVHQSDSRGNITVANLYGNPDKKLTWQLGAQYVHRNIQGNPDITVTEPRVNAGVIWRIPSANLSINPYVGYGRRRLKTDGTVQVGPPPFTPLDISNTDRSDLIHYGVFAHLRWKMIQANANYYITDDLDHNTQNQTLRTFAGIRLSDHLGILTRFEYMEQNEIRDTSFMIGPMQLF